MVSLKWMPEISSSSKSLILRWDTMAQVQLVAMVDSLAVNKANPLWVWCSLATDRSSLPTWALSLAWMACSLLWRVATPSALRFQESNNHQATIAQLAMSREARLPTTLRGETISRVRIILSKTMLCPMKWESAWRATSTRRSSTFSTLWGQAIQTAKLLVEGKLWRRPRLFLSIFRKLPLITIITGARLSLSTGLEMSLMSSTC